MTTAQKLSAAEALIKALQSGTKIVHQTFYQDPAPPGMSREHTERVVQTMLVSIDLYHEHAA